MSELQFALLPGAQQLRHVEPEPVAAHRGALDLPLAKEVVAIQFDLHAERYHADNRHRTTGPQALKTLLRRRLQADRLKRVLHAATGHFPEYQSANGIDVDLGQPAPRPVGGL